MEFFLWDWGFGVVRVFWRLFSFFFVLGWVCGLFMWGYVFVYGFVVVFCRVVESV